MFFYLPAIHTITGPDWWTVIGDRFHAINKAISESDYEIHIEREPSISKYFEYSISQHWRYTKKELQSEATDVSNFCLRKAEI